MKSKKPAAVPIKATGPVDAFMAKLKHPLKAEIESARGIILGVDPAITEEIKWNAPGFRTTESFATTNLRATDQLQFIFHLGAKVRGDVKVMKITDPTGLMKWLAKDRCLVTVGTERDLRKNQAAFEAVVRQWISYL